MVEVGGLSLYDEGGEVCDKNAGRILSEMVELSTYAVRSVICSKNF